MKPADSNSSSGMAESPSLHNEDTITVDRLSPEHRQESSDQVPPLPVPVERLNFRSSPLLSPESLRTHGSTRMATSDGGFDVPTVFADEEWHRHSSPPRVRSGLQRRRGLLAACSTPRSTIARGAVDDLRVHYGTAAQKRKIVSSSASSLLDGLSSPAVDAFSGGANGMYRWPVTHTYLPEPVP